MQSKPENKKCPKCQKPMVKIVSGCSHDELWICNNPACKYQENIEEYNN